VDCLEISATRVLGVPVLMWKWMSVALVWTLG